MRKEEVRADVAAEVPQVLVGPGRAHLAVKAGVGVLGVVPAEPEAVAVQAGDRLLRPHALDDEGVGRRGDVAFQGDGLTTGRQSSGT